MSELADIDVLMITYRRPHYTEQSLRQLLATADDSMRIWLWHNGDDTETLEVVERHASHPRVHQFHHSPENAKLREPTNWLWENSTGEYVSKVDDDCLLPLGWAQQLRRAHRDNPNLGVVGCWRFQPEDFIPKLAHRKIRELAGGHRILQNCWVQGSGYLMKRRCIDELGLLSADQSFTHYCFDAASAGYINGFYYPFIHEDHMDDPRSPNSALKSSEDLRRFAPISALRGGVVDLDQWEDSVRRNAFVVQHATCKPAWQTGWRGRIRRKHSDLAYRRWRRTERSGVGDQPRTP